MSKVTTTCGKCGALYAWENDPVQKMPACPKCGYNPVKVGDTSDIENLLKQLSSDDYVTRNNSAVALGELREKSAVDPLLSMLTPEEIDVCPGVINALGEIGDTRAVKPLIELLSDDISIAPFVREMVILSLTKIGTEESLGAIFNKLHVILPIDLPDIMAAVVLLGKPAKRILEKAQIYYKDNIKLLAEIEKILQKIIQAN